MLTRDGARRAGVGYGAAVSRFDAGAFVACSRLLADSAMAASAAGGDATPQGSDGNAERAGSASRAPAARVPALAGLCAFALGDWDAARADFSRAAESAPDGVTRARVLRLAESARRGPALPHRSLRAAAALFALVPGAGQAYAGHAQDGFRHLLFNAALLYTVASLAGHDQVPAAVIVGSVALPFYAGNVLGARDAARRFNREQRMRLLARAIDDSSR